MAKKEANQSTKLETKRVNPVKWLLYSGIGIQTMLLFAAIADTPKNPRPAGD